MTKAESGISPVALFATGLGVLIIWSGLKGTSAIGGLRSLISGQQPSGSNVNPLGGGSSTAAGSLTQTAATGSAIADQGLKYVGSGSTYKWGGGNPQGWDCSGFCNYVIGHDLGMPIPGSRTGAYSGHGPVTGQWGLAGFSVSRSQVTAGDLVVWPLRHMGIAISNSQMVNCPGPNGTPAPVISPIDENLGPVTYRRIAVTTGTVQAPGTTTIAGRG